MLLFLTEGFEPDHPGLELRGDAQLPFPGLFGRVEDDGLSDDQAAGLGV